MGISIAGTVHCIWSFGLDRLLFSSSVVVAAVVVVAVVSLSLLPSSSIPIVLFYVVPYRAKAVAVAIHSKTSCR